MKKNLLSFLLASVSFVAMAQQTIEPDDDSFFGPITVFGAPAKVVGNTVYCGPDVTKICCIISRTSSSAATEEDIFRLKIFLNKERNTVELQSKKVETSKDSKGNTIVKLED